MLKNKLSNKGHEGTLRPSLEVSRGYFIICEKKTVYLNADLLKALIICYILECRYKALMAKRHFSDTGTDTEESQLPGYYKQCSVFVFVVDDNNDD